MNLEITFVEAIAGGLGGLVLVGFVAIGKLLLRISHDIRHLGPSLEAVYSTLPWLLRATRYQNAALKELGANGSTARSDACLDEAEKNLDRRLAEREGGKP